MGYETLTLLYLVNAVLLIVHEIDSAAWKEWDLFGLPGARATFVNLHLPLTALVLMGLVYLSRNKPAGLFYSILLSAAGIFAFTVHMYFIRKGRPEFRCPVSLTILALTLIVSLVQGALTVYMMLN